MHICICIYFWVRYTCFEAMDSSGHWPMRRHNKCVNTVHIYGISRKFVMTPVTAGCR